MYKLTIISGANRGTSYAASGGEITVGRQAGNTIVLSSSKVSKRHCVFQVMGDQVVLKDLGSSNGTFVNGILTKLRELKPGDRISVGDFVIELVKPEKKTSLAAPAMGAGLGSSIQVATSMPSVPSSVGGVDSASDIDSSISQGPPDDLKGKALWFFEHRFMPIFYSMNMKYDWKNIIGGAFAIQVVGSLIISVYPLLGTNRTMVLNEIGKRARYMAREIAEQNAPYLAARAETKTYIGMPDKAEGVRTAVLIDLDNRILAPGSRLNQYLATGVEALVASRAKKLFLDGRETGFTTNADATTLVAVEPVKVLSNQQGRNVVVAMSVVSIDTGLATPDIGAISMVYSETLILTGLLAAFIFIVLYRVTLKPFEILNEDIDKALKGSATQVTHEFKFEELDSLWDIINSTIQRIPQGGGGGGAGGQFGGPTVDDYFGPLQSIGEMGRFSMVILDEDRKVLYLNSLFEEVSGIRADQATGQDLPSVARDESFGVFVSDILDRAPVGGQAAEEDYDLSGIAHRVYATAFGSVGGSAKCYAIMAVKSEG